MFKRRVFKTTDMILHRREIVARRGAFSVLNDAAVHADFNAQFADLIGSLTGPAFTISIDKEGHLNRYKVWQFDPYHYVLTCLVERYVYWLKRNGFVGDVMGEARTPWHDGRLRRSYRRLYANGSDFVNRRIIQAHLISGELRLELKSMNVAALQIADLLAHPAHRAYKFEKLGISLPDDYGAFLARSLMNIYDRHPNTGRSKDVEGNGFLKRNPGAYSPRRSQAISLRP